MPMKKHCSSPPGSAEVNNNLAWLLLTAKEKAIRNPERALTLARAAILIKEQSHILDTLATAYWANGLVEEAVVTELKALRLDPRESGLLSGATGKI